MSKTSLYQVAEFHRAFGHPIADTLNVQTRELRRLRVELIAEELREFAQAAGVPLKCEVGSVQECSGHCDFVEMADALGDIEYVTLGAQLVFGIPGAAVMSEIHRANMSKLGTDGKPIYREDKKVLKGPNYRAPDIEAVLVANRRRDLFQEFMQPTPEAQLANCIAIQCDPANAYADPYMFGMANGMLLAKGVYEQCEPDYLYWPEEREKFHSMKLSQIQRAVNALGYDSRMNLPDTQIGAAIIAKHEELTKQTLRSDLKELQTMATVTAAGAL